MQRSSSPLGIIPARADSSRFPNKITAAILGKPMIQHVWESARRAKSLGQVLVATDSEAIFNTVKAFGGDAIMTPSDLESGTDRVAWAAQNSPSDIIINLQGDEPLLSPDAIDQLVLELQKKESFPMATLAIRKNSSAELHDPNVVKVVTSSSGRALYFSRQPLSISTDGEFLKHIGIYAFRKETLLRFCEYPRSPLEKAERLEQLRALENDIPIQVITVSQDTIAVDTPSDIARVEKYLKEREPGR